MKNTSRDQLIGRRTFVRSVAAAGAATMLGVGRAPAQTLTAPGITIGMILPQNRENPFSDAREGMELGFDEAVRSGSLFQKPVAVARKSFSSPADAAVAATSLVVGEHATVLIGGGDDDECRSIINACIAKRVVFVNVVSRSDNLRRSVCSKFVYHVEASEAMYASAKALAARQEGSGPPPADCDVVLWHSSLDRYGASQLNDRFVAKAHRVMTGSSWAGWFGVKTATESFFRSGARDGEGVADFLSRDATEFDGHKGAGLTFRTWDHQLRQPLYCLSNVDAGKSPTVKDIPDLARSPGSARQLLDLLGDSESIPRCEDSKK